MGGIGLSDYSRHKKVATIRRRLFATTANGERIHPRGNMFQQRPHSDQKAVNYDHYFSGSEEERISFEWDFGAVATRAWVDYALGRGTCILMEIGVGYGFFLRDAKANMKIGVDISPGTIALAKKTCPEATWIVADFNKLPDAETPDAIVCAHVLEHVEDLGAAFKELRRIIAPGGCLIILSPAHVGGVVPEQERITMGHLHSMTTETVRKYAFEHFRIIWSRYGHQLHTHIWGRLKWWLAVLNHPMKRIDGKSFYERYWYQNSVLPFLMATVDALDRAINEFDENSFIRKFLDKLMPERNNLLVLTPRRSDEN